MRQKKYYAYLILCLSTILLVLAGDRSWAEESDTIEQYDKEISEAKQQQKEIAEKAEELSKEMEEIEQEKDQVLVYIEKLDQKTAALEESLEELNDRIQTTQEELDTASDELAEAEVEKEKQYATMKKRIKYMYENGNQDYLEILFSSKNLTELLNHAEYIQKISSYDQTIFDEYKKTIDQITQKKTEIENKLSELEVMQAEERAEKEALTEMRTRKQEELKEYKKQLKKSEAKAEEYARQAAEAEAEVEELLEKKQEEIDRQNAMGSGSFGGGDGTMRWPLMISGEISSGFGPRSSPTAGASTDHKGIDIAAPAGTPVVAAAAGEVATATYSSSAGNYIMLSHGGSLYTVYMHCSRLVVEEGDTVTEGQVIGYVGSTGISTGAHLHFGVSVNGSYVDPLTYVNR